MDGAITGWKRYVSVQPPISLYLFALSASGSILTEMIVHRICTITLGINRTECEILNDNSSSAEALRIDALVQPRASVILSSKSFVDSIFPACLLLVLGPWSDQFGRRPLLLIGYTGGTLTFFALSVLSIWEISPWFVLIAYIPSAFLGGFCVIILATICYINDTTTEEETAWQLAWLEAAMSVGFLAGMLAGPVIFKQYGYAAVFGTAAVSCLAGTMFVWWSVPETIRRERSRDWKSLFNVRLVQDLVSSCTRKREGFDRCAAWCCIGSLTILVINMQGELTIGYLFVNARLGWDVSWYSVYMATNISLSILGTTIGAVMLKKIAGISKEAVALIALFSSISAAVIRAFVWKAWQMYVSIGAGMFGNLAGPSVRAMLSKSVPSQDGGKVFSVTTSIETLTPFVASSLYSTLYWYSMPPRYPSAMWFVCGGLYMSVAGLVLAVWTRSLKSRDAHRCSESEGEAEALFESVAAEDTDSCEHVKVESTIQSNDQVRVWGG